MLFEPTSPERAAARFRDDGVVWLEKVWPAARIRELVHAYFARYGGLDVGELEQTCIRVGPERYMVTVDFDSPFDQPDLYAHDTLLPLLHELLGERVVLGSLSAVVAYPGAGPQHEHTDHPVLFDSAELTGSLPPFALTVSIPLVGLTESTGGTRLWPGSHRAPRAQCPQEVLLPQLGDCLLVDYRVWHAGTPNRSQLPRPLLYLVYNRPWFTDSVNFYKQPPLRMSPEALAKVPGEHRSLFVMAERRRLR